MSSLEDRIRSAATKYNHLQSILTTTSNAESQLAHQLTLISSLRSDIAASAARLSFATTHHITTRNTYLHNRDSTLRHLALEATCQCAKQVESLSSSEDAYLSALEAENTEKQLNTSLYSQLASALELASSLKALAAQHAQAKSNLESILESIFDTPISSHPDEDAAKQDVALCQSAYQTALNNLAAESSALAHLKSSQLAMRAAVGASKDALSAVTQEVNLFNRYELDTKLRTALADLETHLASARAIYLQAQSVNGRLEDIPQVRVDSREVIVAWYFAGFGVLEREKMEVEGMMRRLWERVVEVGLFVKGRVEKGEKGVEMLRGEVEESGGLKSARERLRGVRERVFGEVMGKEKRDMEAQV